MKKSRLVLLLVHSASSEHFSEFHALLSSIKMYFLTIARQIESSKCQTLILSRRYAYLSSKLHNILSTLILKMINRSRDLVVSATYTTLLALSLLYTKLNCPLITLKLPKTAIHNSSHETCPTYAVHVGIQSYNTVPLRKSCQENREPWKPSKSTEQLATVKISVTALR